MGGAVGSWDEAEEKEDEVWHTKQLSQLFVDYLLPKWHLLLGVPPEPVPTNDILDSQRIACLIKKYLFQNFMTQFWSSKSTKAGDKSKNLS